MALLPLSKAMRVVLSVVTLLGSACSFCWASFRSASWSISGFGGLSRMRPVEESEARCPSGNRLGSSWRGLRWRQAMARVGGGTRAGRRPRASDGVTLSVAIEVCELSHQLILHGNWSKASNAIEYEQLWERYRLASDRGGGSRFIATTVRYQIYTDATLSPTGGMPNPRG